MKSIPKLIIILYIAFTGCSKSSIDNAWELYKKSDFNSALKATNRLYSDSSYHLRGNIFQLMGNYDKALNNYNSIDSSYKDFQKILISKMNILFHHKKDIIKAKEVSKKVLNKESKIFITSLDKTMKLVSKGTFSVPMERRHPLNNYIPHVKAKINGSELNIAFDTGANYLIMSKAQSEKLKLKYNENNYFYGQQGFSKSKMWISSANNFTIGNSLNFTDVPVVILEEINTDIIIFGTSIIKEMLTTIDYPNQQFVFTSLNDKNLIKSHRLKYSGKTMPFTMWGDHYMMGNGFFNEKKINMFFDSGLVVVGVVDGDIKQSWMCMTPENMKILGVLNPDSTSVTKITPTTHSISFAGNNHGNVLLSKSIAEFEFGGVKCDLLISHGVIKNYAWTLDFEKMLYTFSL